MIEHARCTWKGMNGDPFYEAYHDHEWGVPEWESRALWEKLVLDGFQAGLAWITILRKRDSLRAAFANFDPDMVAKFDDDDRARLMADPGIIRSRAKIEAAIRGAQIFVEMRDGGEDFSAWLWSFVDGAPVQGERVGGDIPTQTDASVAMAKALKTRGFNFCGPVIVYAFMQATGMVNDHVAGCFRCEEVRAMGAS
jgi:DNA-3-methyladenine glycosylase I